MLYRLDYLSDDGGTAEAVRYHAAGNDFLSNHASTARKFGLTAAAKAGRAILLTRIGNGGALKPTLVIEPDGTCKPPAGMNSAHDPDARVCFCLPCRAQRKERRTFDASSIEADPMAAQRRGL